MDNSLALLNSWYVYESVSQQPQQQNTHTRGCCADTCRVPRCAVSPCCAPGSAGQPEQPAASTSPVNGNKSFGSVWPWEFPVTDKQDTTADNPKILMAIKLAHYFTFVAQGTLSYMLFASQKFLTSGAWVVSALPVKMTELEVFLVVLGSVYQAAAGGFFVMAHNFDGWEVGRFQWPTDGIAYCNDRLRLVAYQLLWMFQGLGMGTAAYALTNALARAGVSPWSAVAGLQGSPIVVAAVATALLTAWFSLSPWEPNISLKLFKSQDAARTPVVSLAVFIIAATWFAFALSTLVGPKVAWLAVACFASGGLCEAFLAEGTLDQWWHLLAVVIISTGSLLLILGLSSTCGLTLPWLDAAAVAGEHILSSAGWWYVMLGVVAVGMISIARKMPS